MDILACPICKNHPLELVVFAEGEEIDEGDPALRQMRQVVPHHRDDTANAAGRPQGCIGGQGVLGEVEGPAAGGRLEGRQAIQPRMRRNRHMQSYAA